MLVCFLLQVEPQFFRRNKFQPPLSIGSAIKQNSKLEFFEVQPNSSKHIETLQAVFINVSFQSISGYRPRFNHRDLHYTHPHSPPKIISNIALFRSFLPKRPILEENALFRAYFQCLNGGSNMIEIRHNNPYFHQCTGLK